MACLCVIYKDDTHMCENSQYIFFEKCFGMERPSAACRCGKRRVLQFPPTAAAQKTEVRAAFLRQEVASQRPGYGGKKVEVCHQPNGDFHVYLDRRLLHIQNAGADAGPVRAHDFRKTKAPRKKQPVRVYKFAGRPALRT